MSLTKVTLLDIVKKQYVYKLKALSGVYISLVALQAFAILFSFMASSMFGSSTDGISLTVNYYSVDIVLVFTMLWAFIISITLTTMAYRNDDFTFVTNRLSSDLSNFAFLVTVSALGMATALLSGYLQKVVLYFLADAKTFYFTSLLNTPSLILKGVLATFLYILLFASLGYLVGMLIQLHSGLRIILPVLFLGWLFFGGMLGEVGIISQIGSFYFMESTFWVFLIKVLFSISLLKACSILITRRLEVRHL